MTEAKRARNKRAYLKKQAEGRCVNCGKPDDRTRAGGARCEACNRRNHERQKPRARSEEQRAAENAAKREWRQMRREAHLCVDCGQMDRRTLDGRANCQTCATRRNANKRAHQDHDRANAMDRERRARWEAEGRCTNCGRARDEPGRLMCVDCRVRMRMQKWRKNGVKPPRGENGRCWQCNKAPAIEGKRLCTECYQIHLRSIRLATMAAAQRRGNRQ